MGKSSPLWASSPFLPSVLERTPHPEHLGHSCQLEWLPLVVRSWRLSGVSSAFGHLCFNSLTAVNLAAAAQVPILPLCALSSAPPCHPYTYPLTPVLPLRPFSLSLSMKVELDCLTSVPTPLQTRGLGREQPFLLCNFVFPA